MSVAKEWEGRSALRWILTQWCNYACWYCRQSHSRSQTFKGSPGHWADNATVEAWCAALDKHFSDARLSVFFEGGETMLDRKAVGSLLTHLHGSAYFDAARFDTNLSNKLYTWEVPRDKVVLVASLHPSEIAEDAFFAELNKTVASGWRVALVNLVVTPDRVSMLRKVFERAVAAGARLHAIPAFSYLEQFSREQIAELRKYISEVDWPRKTGESTLGKSCLFPSVAWEMYPDGSLHVGCHEGLVGSIFDDELPVRFSGRSPCPWPECCCEDKYHFLEEMDNRSGGERMPTDSMAKRVPLEVLHG